MLLMTLSSSVMQRARGVVGRLLLHRLKVLGAAVFLFFTLHCGCPDSEARHYSTD
jgi:hypothetical protein